MPLSFDWIKFLAKLLLLCMKRKWKFFDYSQKYMINWLKEKKLQTHCSQVSLLITRPVIQNIWLQRSLKKLEWTLNIMRHNDQSLYVSLTFAGQRFLLTGAEHNTTSQAIVSLTVAPQGHTVQILHVLRTLNGCGWVLCWDITMMRRQKATGSLPRKKWSIINGTVILCYLKGLLFRWNAYTVGSLCLLHTSHESARTFTHTPLTSQAILCF